MTEQTTTAPAQSKATAEPKKYVYLVAYIAPHSSGFGYGATTVSLTGGPMRDADIPGVRDFIRKETGRSTADVIAFSRFAD
jgi:hypothetical protein